MEALMHSWFLSSLVRVYPATLPGEQQTFVLEAARGERVSFQVAFRRDTQCCQVTASVAAQEALDIQVRRVGYVPLPHLNTGVPREEIDGVAYLPGLAPDPLLPEMTIHAGVHETNAFWITVRIPYSTAPGNYPVYITLAPLDEDPVTLEAQVQVHAAVLPLRRNFPVTHWFYADALIDWYKLTPFTEEFWTILRPYLADVAAHGQDTIYVPIFTPPLDGVKRPTQLLHVVRVGDCYQFDWTMVRRWIAEAKAHGLTHFEWCHLFTQWGVQHAIRIYEGHGLDNSLLWPPETGAVSPTYRNFLAQFLPEFERFLRDEGLMAQSFFHLSDEPHGAKHLANYRAARELLRELAPWMKVMDALSEISFAREGLTDVPIPSIDQAPSFVAEGLPAWSYFCCGPRGHYLNRLLDTPLVKVRMSGWLFYRLQAHGFLHWGYNYWYKSQTQQLIDPYIVTDGQAWPGWAYGDPFQVYPGADGPVDALRWEIFAESLQDYALLQAAGLDPGDPLLEDIVDYADFPRSEAWILQRRHRLLEILDKRA